MITTPEQMREAAIAACKKVADEAKSYGIPQMTMGANTCYDAIRAIPIAPQAVAVTVKPLVWEDLGNGRAYRAACPLFGSIRIEAYYSGEFHVLWSVPGFCDSFTPGLYETAELAKAAAQADYEARILSALTIQPIAPLSDPRVVALVEAVKAADAHIDKGHYEMARNITRAAIRAIGGEA